MITCHRAAELRDSLARARAQGRRVGFVPTMGYLHEGHLSLCDVARRHADTLVLSIYVNPLQFGPGEDLKRYPRDLASDAALADARGVDLLFVPDDADMYPSGEPHVRVTAPHLADRLCGRFRPGHFDGVLTVVAKLFHLVQPDVAVFGQKDFQQATLVRAMVQDLDFGLEVVVAPIVREADGLAMSSRNVYLSGEERRAAGALSRALTAAQAAFTAGERTPARLIAAAAAVLTQEPHVRVQYVEVVDGVQLETPERARAGDTLALAAFVGATRLIDNHTLA